MLIVTCRFDDVIKIGDTLVRIQRSPSNRSRVRLVIQAPHDVRVQREPYRKNTMKAS